MVPVKQTYAPFGVRTVRNCRVGFHPGLDKSGVMKKPTPLGPGAYDIDFVQCWRNKQATSKVKETWKRKQELEEFSKTLGYKNASVLNDREEDKKKRGPGSIDIDPSLFTRCYHNIRKNISFGKCKLQTKTTNLNPGPGTYGKNHDPYYRIKHASLPYRQWTKLPPFEWDGFVDRFSVGRIKTSANVPPNRYVVKTSGSIQATLDKRVSKRGPYDCFTGLRDSSTIKGYFAITTHRGPKNWPFSLPSDMDRLKSKVKARYGCFLQSERFSPKMSLNGPIDLNVPGPAHYNIHKKKPCTSSKYPFNQSVKHCRPIMKWEIMPGAGRYPTVEPKCSYTISESWQFKSKTKRGI